MSCLCWWSFRRKVAVVLVAILTTSLLILLTSCQNKSKPSSAQESVGPPPGSLELVFTYGSEKEKWIKEVTDQFNRAQNKTSGGQVIYVRPIAMGSGESIDAILNGEIQAHIVSPASAAFITLGNAESRTKTGKDLVVSTDNLVLSPVVIAMWKPMAEAIGWGKKPIGWSDILSLARNQQGWKAYGYPQWGQFKFGHTHPQYSNSGLISVIAEAYAARGKTAGLSLADVRNPSTTQFVSGIEHSVVHYGSSTGFFGRKMFAAGPQYLSAAVLYESMVVESYSQQNLPFPVVAIYPREGTFWSDHPIGIVNRDWVTPAHREAAQIYIKYLLARPQQERAMTYGFRPGDVNIPLASPIDTNHGVDPKEPKTTLEVPSAEVIQAVLDMWGETKKSADIVLVLDTSGSMNENQKIQNARAGAQQLVSLLDGNDRFSLLTFSTDMSWAGQNLSVKTDRDRIQQLLGGLFAQGDTKLYDSIDAAYQELSSHPDQGGRIKALVVLTDGEDTVSKESLDQLLQKIQFNGESHNINIFTIAYGSDARRDVLQRISESTQARMYEGTPKNISEVFREISTFF